MSSTYLRLLIFLPVVWISKWNFSKMLSSWEIMIDPPIYGYLRVIHNDHNIQEKRVDTVSNKRYDSVQRSKPWRTPFLIWNQSLVPCPVLTVASWLAYRFLKSQVRLSGIRISLRIFQFVVIHTVKGLGIVNTAEIDDFLELFCFFDDPADVGNLISGSSALSKTNLSIWKFIVHVLLKPGSENFEHYFTSMWGECNYVVVWAFFGIAFLWDWNENWPFPVLWPLLSFPCFLAYWVQHFHI